MKAEKAALRSSMRGFRDTIPESERNEMGLAIAERVLHAAGAPGLVFIFLSFGSEVPTDPICERLVEAGHALAVPHIGRGELTPVEYVPKEATTPAVWGIREPSVLRPVGPDAIDVVIAPGLAFDREGFRLGYGGGYYDRLLERCRTDVIRAGICFHGQVVPQVPHDENDERLDMVITDQETITCV